MEKEFVIYPLALRMKALGYDERCMSYFADGKWNFGITYNSDERDFESISTPTWQSAFRWFREKHGLSGWVDESFGGSLRRGVISIKSEIGSEYYPTTTKLFYTYEEAELDCLEKLIEIVENNK
jgi:hypothetical protein